MAEFTRGRTFSNGEQLSPAKLNSLINNATLGSVTADDLGTALLPYSYGDTAPACTGAHIWYDTTAGSEGLKYAFVSTNLSIASWLYATPRREGIYWVNEAVSLGTPLFVFQKGSENAGVGWRTYDGVNLPMVFRCTARSQITPQAVVAMESVSGAGPVKCAWTGIIPADTLGSQVSIGDLLYIDPDAPTKFKVGSFNLWRNRMLAHWTLNEAAGATRSDTLGTLHLQDTGTVPQTAGKVDAYGAEFNDAGGHKLSRAAHASLDFSSDSLTLSCHMQINSKSGTKNWFVVGQVDAAWADRAFYLFYDRAVDRMKWATSPDGSSGEVVIANNFGAVPVDTWFHVLAWYNESSGQIGIRINNGTADTTAGTSGGLNVSSADLMIGGTQQGASWDFDGKIDHVTIWKGRIFSAWEAYHIYNFGDGQVSVIGNQTANVHSMICGCALNSIPDNAILPSAFLLWGGGAVFQDITS
jgi:hypothetical protein